MHPSEITTLAEARRLELEHDSEQIRRRRTAVREPWWRRRR